VVKVTLNHSGSTYILVVYGSNHADVSAVSKLVAGGHTSNFKMVLCVYVVLQPLRPELDGQDQVQTIVTYCTNVHMIID
jgi:hypothetical protein